MTWRELPSWCKGVILSAILTLVTTSFGIILSLIGQSSESSGFGILVLVVFIMATFFPSLLLFSFIGYLIDRRKSKLTPPIKDSRTWEGMLSLVFVALSIISVFVPFLILPVSIPSALLSIIASRSQIKHNPTKAAKVAFVLSIIILIISFIVAFFAFAFLSMLDSGNFPTLGVR